MTDPEIKAAAISRIGVLQEQIRQMTDELVEIVNSTTETEADGFTEPAVNIVNKANDFQQAVDEAKDFILD